VDSRSTREQPQAYKLSGPKPLALDYPAIASCVWAMPPSSNLKKPKELFIGGRHHKAARVKDAPFTIPFA
jgi:hypothetical protein